MDLSSVMTTLLSSDSVKNLSKKTGSSQKEVTSVLTNALPLLLEGATGQAKNKSTSESFVKALAKHSDNDTSNIASFLGNVDMEDGAKIIGHLLGADVESTTKKVSKSSDTSSDNTAQILAAAAPLLMSLLGQETKKSSKKSSKNDLTSVVLDAVLDNVDVGSLLTGLLTDKEETKTTAKKKTTTKKSTTSKKSTAAKKTTTAKKSTAKTTTKKAATKKKAASDNDGIDIGDVASVLTKLLK